MSAIGMEHKMVTRTKRTDIEKFNSHWILDETTSCWEWTAYTQKNGYGTFGFRHKMHLAHRASYILFVGEIPIGLQLDHLCRNRACVNPAHLEPVTNKENILRGISPSAINARKELCIRAHLLTGDNLAIYGNERRCRTCDRERKRRST